MSEARIFEPTAGRARTVTVIPARIRTLPGIPTLAVQKKRVAAYARVSTNSEEQLTSYEAQVKHYTEYIKSKETSDNWQFVGIFSIGVSGKYTLTRSWLLLRRRILLPVRFLSHTGSDFLSQRPCYGNADLIAEPAFPYSVFRRLPARKNGQQSFYPLLPVHEQTKACAFRLVKLYRGLRAWLTCSFCF